jgi:hypothetical protein
MPQEYDSRKTTSVVRLNSKLSATDLEHFEDGGVDVAEGVFINEDANGKAKIALGTDREVFINFLATSHGSVRDEVKDYFDESAPDLSFSTGGLTGIIGRQTPIGLHKSKWIGGTATKGHLVTVGAGGLPESVAKGSISTTPHFGVVHRVRGDYIWFIFQTTAQVG